MYEIRSRFFLIAGFLFWFSVAYFFYRYGKGATLYVLIAGGFLALLYWPARFIGALKKRRPEPPPRSDLPDMNFSDAKPKDFE